MNPEPSYDPSSMTPNTRFLALTLLGLLLTAATGYAYGRLSQRWGPSVDMVAAGDHLRTLPRQVGDWRMLNEQELEESVAKMLECAGSVTRDYINQKTGDKVTMFIVVGPPGPIAVHTPEVCYSSRQYKITEKRQRATFAAAGARPNTLWQTTMQSKRIATDNLRVYFGWSQGDRWEAASNPRYRFGADPMLYKIQIAGLLDVDGTDPCRQFLESLFASTWKLAAKKETSKRH